MQIEPYVVLVGMDFSELANRALQQAFELAAQHTSSEVHVVCVVPGASLEAHHGLTGYFMTAEVGVRDGVFESLRAHVQAKLDAFTSRVAPDTRPPAHIASHVRIGAPSLGIIELACEIEANLIVLGAYGHHGPTRQSFGSVAENTVRYAACPVLVVPLEKQTNQRSEPPWTSITAPPRSATHQPSVRPSSIGGDP